MEHEGWQVSYIEDAPVNLYCTRYNRTKLIRAFGKGHGHTYKRTVNALSKIEGATNTRIFIAKLNSDNQIYLQSLNELTEIRNKY